MRRIAGLLAALAVAWQPAWSDEAADLARDAARQLDEAAVRLTDASDAVDQVAALTRTVRAYEAGLGAMREGLRRAELREREIRTALEANEGELTTLLSLLATTSRQAQTETLIHPGGALQTIRAGTLAAAFVPSLNERVNTLKADLTDLDTLVSLQKSGIATLEAGSEGIRTARLRLSEAIAARGDLPDSVSTDDAAIEALVNSAETLAAFADSLMPDKGPEGWVTDGAWSLPVTGEVLREYDEADAAGVRRPGWILSTPDEALVTAPVPASVRFAGDVPGQGGVAILEPNPGSLVILAGLASTFVRRGQTVSVGEPIGLMGKTSLAAQENLNGVGGYGGVFGGETLYLEIRQRRTPVDPAGMPWTGGGKD